MDESRSLQSAGWAGADSVVLLVVGVALCSLVSLLFTGRTWRYELELVEGGTRIREIWDVSTEALPTRFLLKPLLAEHTRESMERTLARIEELLRD